MSMAAKNQDKHYYQRNRRGCKDVFYERLLHYASYAGPEEMPVIAPEQRAPSSIVLYSKACTAVNKNLNLISDAWIAFYEDDCKFINVLDSPDDFLALARHYGGVIAPDFSIYRDFPVTMQMWQSFKAKMFAQWLQQEGISVIPNVRWGAERSYSFCWDGIPHHSVIAVGSHGCLRVREEREYFIPGLQAAVNELEPSAIVVYGSAPDSIFGPLKKSGIEIRAFESDCERAHRNAALRESLEGDSHQLDELRDMGDVGGGAPDDGYAQPKLAI